MAQLSRPYQILLGAVVVFGLIWAVALRGHAPNPSEPSSTTPRVTTAASSPSTSAAAEAKAAAAPTPVYHGPAPGIEGLTRAIAKAHGAVATSQRNAQELESKSSAASNESRPSTTRSVPSKAAASVTVTRKSTAAPSVAHAAPALAHRTAGSSDRAQARVQTPPRSSAKPHSGIAVEQLAVEHELAGGKTVMLLIWNPKSTVDQDVRTQVKALAGHSRGRVTLHLALANEVGEFGKITEVAHIYQTPTILIVNKHGLVSTLTGLTDVFALEQAVREAQSAVS